ncbi:hypothetical protein [Streptomyces paludis]|uniref:hypothetical protein n=1 Tax=Streptomyces paludis TaxID=2282738 RepID=UPI0015F2E53C|nr:hypothetical protein [Streptomyces paludis]
MDPLIDRALARALERAVARAGAPGLTGRIRFTERQLYYEVCRALRPLHAYPRRVRRTPAPPVPYERFEAALRRYADGGGDLGGLLGGGGGGGSRVAPLAEPCEPDLYDYGLPRLLVCQSRSVARMLLANDLHLEAACPVLAADDLPLDPRLVAGLGRVDGATVHVLHDASAAGMALTARVRDGVEGAPGPVRVVSLGLVPRHAMALHLVAGKGKGEGPGKRAGEGPGLPAGLPATLTARERAWLAAGRFAEVESVPPARLLRTVLRLVCGPRTPVHSVWTGLRTLRTAGFMTWPAENRPGGETRTTDDEPATRNPVQG